MMNEKSIAAKNAMDALRQDCSYSFLPRRGETENAKISLAATQESLRITANTLHTMASELGNVAPMIGKPYRPDPLLGARALRDAGRFLVTACSTVSNFLLGRAGFDVRKYVNSNLAHQIARHIAEKLNLDVTVERDDEPWSLSQWCTRYTGRFYVLTESQLRELIDDTIRRATTPGSL